METTKTTTPLSDERLYKLCKHFGKLARIVSVATVENQEFLANQVQLLPKSSLETLARDIKQNYIENRLPGQNARSRLGGRVRLYPDSQNLKLSPEVIAKLSELQNKGLDINELILEFLKTREEKIESEKDEISAQTSVAENSALATAKKPSRYIPAKTKKLLHATYGTKCAISHCQKPSQTIHHTTRFAISTSHDPHFLAPLCREHHQIAHSIDYKFHSIRTL